MSEGKTVFVDSEGLLKIARSDLRNQYMMYSGRGGESDANPLPMLIHRKHGKYFLKTDETGLVVAAVSFYPYAKGSDPRYPDGDFIYLSQVGVHKDHRRNGYAKSLLNSVFALAAKTDSVLLLSSFEPDGRSYLAPVLPDIHHKHPGVKVLHDGMAEPVTGERRYKLVCDWGTLPVQYL